MARRKPTRLDTIIAAIPVVIFTLLYAASILAR